MIKTVRIMAFSLVLTLSIFITVTYSSFGYHWEKTFGGESKDIGYSVEQTTDGGFIIVGFNEKENFNPYINDYDVYLIKTDADGNEVWSKTFGGSLSDVGHSVQQTDDDGFIIVGDTKSFGVNGQDVYLIKTDNDGNEIWSKTFGGTLYEGGSSVRQTADGGYIITGSTNSFGIDPANAGITDVYLIKTDADGNEIWSKTFGGTLYEGGSSVRQTTDGGYIIIGSTNAYSEDFDFYLIKTDSNGNEVWSKALGTVAYDVGLSV